MCIYNTMQRDGMGFNLAYIGSDFTQKLPEPFDQGYCSYRPATFSPPGSDSPAGADSTAVIRAEVAFSSLRQWTVAAAQHASRRNGHLPADYARRIA